MSWIILDWLSTHLQGYPHYSQFQRSKLREIVSTWDFGAQRTVYEYYHPDAGWNQSEFELFKFFICYCGYYNGDLDKWFLYNPSAAAVALCRKLYHYSHRFWLSRNSYLMQNVFEQQLLVFFECYNTKHALHKCFVCFAWHCKIVEGGLHAFDTCTYVYTAVWTLMDGGSDPVRLYPWRGYLVYWGVSLFVCFTKHFQQICTQLAMVSCVFACMQREVQVQSACTAKVHIACLAEHCISAEGGLHAVYKTCFITYNCHVTVDCCLPALFINTCNTHNPTVCTYSVHCMQCTSSVHAFSAKGKLTGNNSALYCTYSVPWTLLHLCSASIHCTYAVQI